MHELLPDYTKQNKSDAIVKNYLLNKQFYKCQFCNRDIDINYKEDLIVEGEYKEIASE